MKSHIVEAGFVKERLGKRQGTYRASHKFCRQFCKKSIKSGVGCLQSLKCRQIFATDASADLDALNSTQGYGLYLGDDT